MIIRTVKSDGAWDTAFHQALKQYSETVDTVRTACILQLLALGARLDELCWMGEYLIHKPTGFGYQFRFESGERFTQYIAEPVVKIE